MNSENALFFGNRRPIGEELQSTCYNTPIKTLSHSRDASENTDNQRMANYVNISFKFIKAESPSVKKDENSNTIIVSHPRIIMPTDGTDLIFNPQLQPVTETSTRNGLIGYVKTIQGLYESDRDPIVKEAMNHWKELQPQMANYVNISFKFIKAESPSVKKDDNSNTIIVSHPRIIMPTDGTDLIFNPQLQPVTETSTRNGLIGYVKTIQGLYESDRDPIVKEAMNLWKELQPQGPSDPQ